jgi:6-phosphogluconolactonase
MQVGKLLRRWCLGILVVTVASLAITAVADDGRDREQEGGWGAVFTLTNDPTGNALAVFLRNKQGQLADPILYPTGGIGTNGGLGNQGALAFDEDSRHLYAVNPGSNTITVFQLGRSGPRAIQMVSSGGTRPISLTIHDELLYVLNAGGATAGGVDSIAGFHASENGLLTPLTNSIAVLSAANTAPAQISFDADGDVLMVTEKATNMISLFAVNKQGIPQARKSVASLGGTPFGFAFADHNRVIVSEAFGGAANASAVSSYQLKERSGTLTPISTSVPTKQTAACWIAIPKNGEYAYTTNTASRTITGYELANDGKLTALNANGITAQTGAAPTDVTILGNRTLYVLNSGDRTVGVYEMGRGGSLTLRQTVGGLPATRVTGLIVR